MKGFGSSPLTWSTLPTFSSRQRDAGLGAVVRDQQLLFLAAKDHGKKLDVVQRVPLDEEFRPNRVRWSFSERQSLLALWSYGSPKLLLFDLHTSELLEETTPAGTGITCFVWGLTDDSWIVGSQDGWITVREGERVEPLKFKVPRPSVTQFCSDCKEYVNGLALSPTGDTLVVAQDRRTAFVFSLPLGELTRELHHPSPGAFVRSVEFDESGKRLLSSTWNSGTSWMWNADTWKLRWSVGEVFGCGAPHFAQFGTDDSRVLAFGQGPIKARVIDTDSGRVLQQFEDRGVMRLLTPSRGGRLQATTSSPGPSLLGIDPTDYSTRYRVLLFQGGDSLTLTPSLYYAGSPARADSVLLRRGKESVPLSNFEALLLDPKRVKAQAAGTAVRLPRFPERLAPEPLRDYSHIFSAGHRALESGDLVTAEKELQAAIRVEPESPSCWYALSCVSALAGDVEVAHDRLKKAVQHGYLDADVALWDKDLESLRGQQRFKARLSRMRAGTEGLRIDWKIMDGPTVSDVHQVAPGPTAQEVFVRTEDGALRILDLNTAAVRPHPFDFVGTFTRAPKMSPDRSRALTAHENGFLLWTRPPTGLWKTTRYHGLSPSEEAWNRGRCSFSPSGEYFAVFGRKIDGVAVYRSEDGSPYELVPLAGSHANCLVWTKDSETWIAGLDDARIVSHRIADRGSKEHFTKAALESVEKGVAYWSCDALALNHANDRLVVSSEDGSLNVYSYPEFEPVAELWPRDDWSRFDSMIFDRADSRLLVSRAYGGCPYMYDAKSWELLWERYDLFGTPAGHFAEWSADERFVFTFGEMKRKAFIRDSITGDVVTPLQQYGVMQLLETAKGLPFAAKAWSKRACVHPAIFIDEEDYSLRHQITFFEKGEHLAMADPPFYTGDVDRASHVVVQCGALTSTLDQLAPQLLDPKRVRARAAGIRLRRPVLMD